MALVHRLQSNGRLINYIFVLLMLYKIITRKCLGLLQPKFNIILEYFEIDVTAETNTFSMPQWLTA